MPANIHLAREDDLFLYLLAMARKEKLFRFDLVELLCHTLGIAPIPLRGLIHGSKERKNMANQVVLKTECLRVKKGGLEK